MPMALPANGRTLTYAQAINEALDLCLGADPSVYLMGLGVPDPKGIFGSTLGLQQRHGPDRVMDMPCSEHAMTGVAIGSALVGLRPIMTHQRIDFALLAVEQLVNQAAKWHYMFGGRSRIPLVVRMIIGRGWGQGPQHSQSLQAWFAHVPGLKVVMPTTPYDVKGLLIAAVEDDNPVIVLEHRWLYHITGVVPEGRYRVPIGTARIARTGKDLTIAATSYMVLEALRAAERLATLGIEAEVVDVRSLRPLDQQTILGSVRKTGRALIADTGWVFGGFSAELSAQIAEQAFERLQGPPRRIGLADSPVPTSRALARWSYPRARDVIAAAGDLVGLSEDAVARLAEDPSTVPDDVPDPAFTGPF